MGRVFLSPGNFPKPENQNKTMKKVSWKTTVGGIVLAGGQAILATGNPTYEWVGHILTALGGFLVGASARDNNVTSEQSGAK